MGMSHSRRALFLTCPHCGEKGELPQGFEEVPALECPKCLNAIPLAGALGKAPSAPNSVVNRHESGAGARMVDGGEDASFWADARRWLLSREGVKVWGSVAGVGALATGLYFSGFFSFLGADRTPIERLTNVAIPAAMEEQPVLARSVGGDLIRGAYVVLDQFLKAPSVEEKLKWVIRPEEVAPRLRQFYATRPLQEKLVASEFTPPERVSVRDLQRGIVVLMKRRQPGKERSLLLENVPARESGANGRGMEPIEMIVFLRQTDDGMRLDFETFAQVRGGEFREFLGSHGVPGTFRVRLTRAHYFGDRRLPGNAISIQIDDVVPLPAEEQPFVFVPASTDLGVEINQNLPWSDNLLNSTRYATVRLAWKPSLLAPDEKRLVVEELICWELLGVGSNTENG